MTFGLNFLKVTELKDGFGFGFLYGGKNGDDYSSRYTAIANFGCGNLNSNLNGDGEGFVESKLLSSKGRPSNWF